MRVDNPRFLEEAGVICLHCPFTDERGNLQYSLAALCNEWVEKHDDYCPRNMEEYTAACLMAEEAAKGGKG